MRVLVWMQGITKNCQLLCCEIRKCLAPCSHASTRDSKTFRMVKDMKSQDVRVCRKMHSVFVHKLSFVMGREFRYPMRLAVAAV